jgi:diguanylate cyclase (GGDEF)-like protein/PAS domain S-box-containing protein
MLKGMRRKASAPAPAAEHLRPAAQLAEELDAVKAELALYRDAVESLPQGLCLYDEQGRVALFNRRYAQLMQIDPAAMRPGLTGADIVRLAIEAGHHPGRTVEDLHREISDQLAESSPWLRTLVRNDGSFKLRKATTDSGQLLTLCEDISVEAESQAALRESEARLNAIFEGLPDCVKIFDESGRMIHINPKGLEFLEAPDLESLRQPGYMMVPPEYLAGCLDTHQRVMAGESVVWTYEMISLRGRRRHVEAHAVPFRMPDGSKVHLCISRDVEERHQAHKAVLRSEERLRLVQETTGLADFEAVPGKIIPSPAFLEQSGLPANLETISFEEWLNVIHPEDRHLLVSNLMANPQRADIARCEFRIIRPDNGEVRWISSRTQLKRDDQGRAVASIGAHLDVTERKVVEMALRESEERFRLAAEAAGLGVWDYDLGQDRREWSDRLREIFGIAPEVEAHLSAIQGCVHPGDRARFMRVLQHARQADVGRFELTFRIQRPNDGAERWVSMSGWRTLRGGDPSDRVIMTVRDVTEEKTAEERVRWSASHDSLTRLANRTLFQEKLEQAIQAAASDGCGVGVLMLDLDHFKQINDTLGHDAGDMLLKLFAERLRLDVRGSDTVARLGGDEFAIVMPDIDSDQSVIELSRSIQERLRAPFIYQGRLLDCRVSMGASLYPKHGRSAEQLLKSADLALYASKAAGRGRVSLFETHMGDEAQRRGMMVQLARYALDHDQIIPYYQPKLDLAGRSIVGFEALLRWRMPNGRIGMPGALEAAFEEPDVAAEISDRMIDRVIADMRGWLSRGVPFQHVAVNASAAEFRRDNFAERVIEQLGRADIPTRCFQLEVTETVFLGRGAEYVHRALALLNQRGIKIALDDFGTGYASLRHLKQFPVDVIKIDQSFVRDMDEDQSEAIIRAVINLGRSLGIKVVAEGIETETQERRLMELKCDFGQGFLFSRAVAASRIPGLLERWQAPPVRAAHDLRLAS